MVGECASEIGQFYDGYMPKVLFQEGFPLVTNGPFCLI